jgi:hypothetical protein
VSAHDGQAASTPAWAQGYEDAHIRHNRQEWEDDTTLLFGRRSPKRSGRVRVVAAAAVALGQQANGRPDYRLDDTV